MMLWRLKGIYIYNKIQLCGQRLSKQTRCFNHPTPFFSLDFKIRVRV